MKKGVGDGRNVDQVADPINECFRREYVGNVSGVSGKEAYVEKDTKRYQIKHEIDTINEQNPFLIETSDFLGCRVWAPFC